MMKSGITAIAVFLALAPDAFAQAEDIVENDMAFDEGRFEQSIIDDRPPSKNPASVRNRIDQIDEFKQSRFEPEPIADPFDAWHDFKVQLNDELGLRFGLFYAPMVQTAKPDISNHTAAGGTFNFDLAWNLVGRGTDSPGYLLFRAQDRHRYNNLAPTSLFLQAGSLWPTTIGYNEFHLSVLDLSWQQHFIENRFVVQLGRMIPFAKHDYFRDKSPFDGFNDALFTLNPTIAYSPTALGIATLIRPTEDFYITAGLYDANGKPQQPGFDTFFHTREYLTMVDIGWDPGFINPANAVYVGDMKVSDVHATFWHKDELSASNTPGGWGVTLFAEGEIGNLVPFIRAGYSSGTGGGPALLNRMVAGGIGIKGLFGYDDDVLGIGVGWGQRDLGRIDTDFDGVPDTNVGDVHQVSTE
ncbi:MAG: carbohydrate porin, partial [Rhizobiaceae bacterium]